MLTAVWKKGCCWYWFPSGQKAFIKNQTKTKKTPKTQPTKKPQTNRQKKRDSQTSLHPPPILRARLTNEGTCREQLSQSPAEAGLPETVSIWWTVTDANSQAHANWCPMDISIQKQRFLLDNLPKQLLAPLPQEGFLVLCISSPKRVQALLGADFNTLSKNNLGSKPHFVWIYCFKI